MTFLISRSKFVQSTNEKAINIRMISKSLSSVMIEGVAFSEKDSQVVRDTWNVVRGDISGVGVAVFMEMFEQHPNYHLLFKKFKHVPIKDLPRNQIFLAHATIVAKALDEAIMSLVNLEKAKNALMKIGSNHSDKNMNADHFIHCNDATIRVLKRTLKENFDENVERAWNAVLPVVATLIVDGMKANE